MRVFSLKKIIFILSLFFLSFFPFSCIEDSHRNILVLALRADPIYLNPVLAHETPSMMVNQWIFNGLVKLDEKLLPVPELASSWEISGDGKKWLFHLRKDVKWHDGYPFTSRDVKFTIDTILDPKTNTYNRGLFIINDVPVITKIIDDYTIEINLPKPFAPLLTNLSAIGIIPEHILNGQDINLSDFNSSPVGTGPFKFKEWRAGETIILEGNQNYYKGSPELKEVVFRIIPGGETRLIALESGQIDAGEIPSKEYERISKFQELVIYRWYDLMYYYMGFDLTNPMFQDPEMRRALNYAIDRQKIVDSVLQGYGKVATGPIPYSSWAYTPDVKKYDYDPEKAKAILLKQGWSCGSNGILTKNNKPLSFTLHYGQGSPSSDKASVFIQYFLKEIGVEVKIRPVEFSVLVTEIANPGKFQAILLDWVENPDPDCFVEWGTDQVKSGMNFMSYSNKEVDTILQLARTNMDVNERKILYQKFQKVIADEAPYVFLWYPESMIGVNRNVKGLSLEGPAGLFLYPEKITVSK